MWCSWRALSPDDFMTGKCRRLPPAAARRHRTSKQSATPNRFKHLLA